MQDMLSLAASWLDGMRRENLSRYVSYRRGSGVTAPFPATIAGTVFEVQSEMGVVERWESRDFIVSATDFPEDVPQRGDQITETIGGTTVTYEVCAPRGMPVWKYADPYRKAFRIFAKAIGEE
jgi:hypothetical protein